MSIPKISIIVPVYKVEKYLERCVDSIINQTLKNIEIILVDDGSPDHSGDICDEYAKQDNRIKVIHQKNGGISKARNAGMDIATGEYIGFVDSDDYIEPLMYEKMYGIANFNDLDLCICNYYEEYEHTNIIKAIKIKNNDEILFNKREVFEYIIRPFYNGELGGYVWNKIYKRNIINDNKIRFVNGLVLYEDNIFFLELLTCINSAAYLNLELIHYMRNNQSICSTFNLKKYEYMVEMYNARTKVIGMLDFYDEELLIKSNEMMVENCLSIILEEFDKKNKLPYLKKVERIKNVIHNEIFERNICATNINDKTKKRIKKYLLSNNIQMLILYLCCINKVIKPFEYYKSGIKYRLERALNGKCKV